MEYNKELLSEFILEYVVCSKPDGSTRDKNYIMSEWEIREAIKIMIAQNVFGIGELRKQLLREKGILISEQFINDCVSTEEAI